MRFTDRIAVSDLQMTGEGYLRASARLSRTGIQDYMGYECGKAGDDATRVFRIYRPSDEVFAPETLASFRLKPVTDAHPIDNVTAKTWRKEAVGIVGEDVRQEGEHTAATLLITDADIANRIQRNGSVELSCGYDCDLDETPGVTDAGESYDAVQRNIRGNHVAIVEQGRCGPSCKVGADAMPKMTDCPGNSRCQCQRTPDTKGQDDMTTKTVTVDGKQLEVTADVAAVIEGMQAKIAQGEKDYGNLKDAAGSLAEIVERHTKVKADEIAAKDAEIADLKAKVPTADQLQAMADERASVIADAKTIAPDIVASGKALDAIRKEAVGIALGNDAKALDGKSADYIAATFDRLVLAAKDAASDPVTAAFKSGTRDAKISPRDAYLARTANAWKGE